MRPTNRTIHLIASVKELAESEVRRHIGEDKYQAIRTQDEHPYFVALDVGYEGQSTGEIEGMGNRVKHWFSSVIDKVGRLLNGPGDIGLYENHAQIGTPRRRLGDIISGFSGKGEDGLTHAYAIGYVSELEARGHIDRGELDVCSIEAECAFELNRGTGQVTVQDVIDIDGVAMANSKTEQPGFAGAGIVAIIRELEQGETNMEPTREQIRQAIQTQVMAAFFNAAELQPVLASVPGLQPSSIFAEGVLESDPVVRTLRDKGLTDSAVELNQLRTKNGELSTQVQSLQKDANKGKVGGLLATAIGVDAYKALTVDERAIVQEAVSGQDFAADDETALKAAVEGAVKKQVDHIDRMRKAYGKEPIAEGADMRKPEEDQTAAQQQSAGDDPFLKNNPEPTAKK